MKSVLSKNRRRKVRAERDSISRERRAKARQALREGREPEPFALPYKVRPNRVVGSTKRNMREAQNDG